MLHIILTILKIIGIIILVILSLIILIAACILFVPIRYSADISYEKELSAKAKITYLLHFITIRYDNRNGNNIVVKIFGIKTRFFNKELKKKEKEYDKETEMFEKMSRKISKTDLKMPEKYEQFKKIDEARDELVDSDSDSEKNNFNDNITDDEYKSDSVEEDDISEKEEKKTTIFNRFFGKIKAIINKFKYRFKHFCDTIRKICKNVKELKEFISDDKTKEAYYFVKAEVITLLKHIRPRKINGFIHFGFDDPSYTGKLLGLIYIFTRGTHKNFQINADFENRVLEGDIHIKGRVQVIVLLIVGLKLYRNENLKLVLERRRTNGRE